MGKRGPLKGATYRKRGYANGHKVCLRCSQRFPATSEYFPPHATGRGGLHFYCHSCRRAYNREWKAENGDWRGPLYRLVRAIRNELSGETAAGGTSASTDFPIGFFACCDHRLRYTWLEPRGKPVTYGVILAEFVPVKQAKPGTEEAHASWWVCFPPAVWPEGRARVLAERFARRYLSATRGCRE